MGTATHATVQELLGLERTFWDAMKAKDGRTAGRMTNDSCIVVGAQGVSAIDTEMMEKMTGSGEWELKEYSFDEKTAQVYLIGDSAALVAYKVHERLMVDGKPL